MSKREATHKASRRRNSAAAVRPYKRLGLLLLHAAVTADELALVEYNAARVRLWGRFQTGGYLPSGDEFREELSDLFAMLKAVGIRDGVRIGGERGEAILRAKRWLDMVAEEARASGVSAPR
jgi:hypothetical protein